MLWLLEENQVNLYMMMHIQHLKKMKFIIKKDAEGFIRLNALRLVIAGKNKNNFDLKR